MCHPELKKFRRRTTAWGCRHEETGRKAYVAIQAGMHQEFKVQASGPHISEEHGFMAATPDGLVNNSCCGDGICEIKVRPTVPE